MGAHYLGALILLIITFAVRRWAISPPRLPPGPKPLPFIGNLHQLPKDEPYRAYRDWSKIYGPIIHIRIFGRKFIILNSLKAISDLYEKRSTKYSSRPQSIMGGQLVGREETAIIFMKYGRKWKQTRQLIHRWLSSKSIEKQLPMQYSSSFRLLKNLLADPEHFSEHIRISAGSIILKMVYGLDCRDVDDPWIAMSEEVQRITAVATEPGRWLVDSFPWLRFLPPFLPGTSFLQWAKQSRRVAHDLVRAPFNKVKQDVQNGSASPSFLYDELIHDGRENLSDADEDVLVCAAGSLYAAGIDTIVSTTRMFFYLMAKYPEVQRKAQDEIDTVIGHRRLATVNDRDTLPYIDCLIKELFRVNAVAHLVPHSLDEDDIYEDYVIPKGAWVIANIWAVLHDPSTYHDPENFNPDRFDLSRPEGPEMDPTLPAFCVGLGRRFCPAYQFSQNTMFLYIVHILAVFNIKVSRSTGQAKMEFDIGHIRSLKPFTCEITLRSPESRELIDA